MEGLSIEDSGSILQQAVSDIMLIWPSTDWLKDVPAICICIDTVRLTWLECRGPVKGCAAIWEYPPAVEGIHLLANSVFFAALSIPGQYFTSLSPLIEIQKSMLKQ